MDQETVDLPSLSGVKKDLISTSVMLHKDRGVKAYAACCMADLLRLYAPDAPYTAAELKVGFHIDEIAQLALNGLLGRTCSNSSSVNCPQA